MKRKKRNISAVLLVHSALLVCLGSPACGWFDNEPLHPADGVSDAAPDPGPDADAPGPDELPDPVPDAPSDFRDPDAPPDLADVIDSPADTPYDELQQDVEEEEEAGCVPESSSESDCGDDVDNDCDDATDCEDSDCYGSAECCDDTICHDGCTARGYDGGTCTCGGSACTCDLLFQDDFSTVEDWYVTTNSNCEYSYDFPEYVIITQAENYLCWANVPGGDSYTDFTVEVDCRVTTTEPDDGCGLLLRYTETSSADIYYYFEILNRGDFRLSLHDPDWTTLSGFTHSDEILGAGDTNRIKITALGPDMSFCVNGRTVLTWSDDTLTSGNVSLVSVNYGGDPARAYFDNFRLFGG
jgi:hypothetical protein